MKRVKRKDASKITYNPLTMKLDSSASPVNRQTETTALTDTAKLNDVTRLLAILKEDLEFANLSQEQRKVALEQLKIYGRDPKDAEPIFTKDGIEILTKHGLNGDSSPSSLEALRCLANAMLLDSKTRQIFVDLGGSDQAAERLKNQNSDNEFIISRILFLTTYESNLDFDPLFDKHALGESINSHIARHARQFINDSEENEPTSFDQAALSESLKLLFNLSNYYPHHISTFHPSIEDIFKILNGITVPTPPLQPPVTYLINALVNLIIDLEKRQEAFASMPTTSNPNTYITTLITILSLAVYTPTSIYPSTQLDSLLSPLLTLLRKIYAISSSDQKQYMQSLLLPAETERDLPLGKSDTLPSKLLRLSTSPTAPNLREGISSLLFDLSEQDPNLFVRNVGYGFAAGFLVSHELPVPEPVTRAQATTRTPSRGGARAEKEKDKEEAEPVNPITGQKLSKEELVDTGPEMSDEEKEREAERLFVLFERLRATGVVDVGYDPVREAVEKGAFVERGNGGSRTEGASEKAGRKGRKNLTGGGRVEEVEDD